MPRMMHETKPFMTKREAESHANNRRKQGYKVSVKKANTYARTRGWKYQTTITGVRK